MTKDQMMNLGLPKWPQMIVTGKPVSEEQALEIIRRTDSFFSWPSGNNHVYIEEAVSILNIPYRKPGESDGDFREFWSCKEEWERKWGLIKTEYVINDWVSCSFIGAPHGWCHPDGSIGYADNVGKWPSVEEVYNEWLLLAKEFPFIELEVTLMNGESCEEFIEPVVSMLIRSGAVELVDPKERDLHKEFGRKKEQEKDMEECMLRILSGAQKENAISLEQLKRWHSQVFGG